MTDYLSEIVESSEPERLATGFVFTEGPLWHTDGYLLFVDIRSSRIFKLAPGGEPEVVREDSGESNGMALDSEGRVVICEMVTRRVARMEPDGSYSTLADRWNAQRLNRPNDVVCKSDGSLYFTNTGRERLDPASAEMPFNSVHRIFTDGAGPDSVGIVAAGLEYPNGLAFSPDESVLYVSNTRPGQYILAFDLDADGNASAPRLFAEMPSATATNGVPDGMKVDEAGRVYCTGPDGCWVFDPSGDLLGIIRLPEFPANCGWGGDDGRTMFFTANTSVYSLRLRTRGASARW